MKNILELLETSANSFPNKIAFDDTKKRVTYSELESAAKRVGNTYNYAAKKNRYLHSNKSV